MALETRDYFDKARSGAAAALFAAGAAAILGALLDWVSIRVPDDFPEGAATEPFNGIEARDGWWVIGAGAVIVISALMLIVRRRGSWAILAFLASIVIGAIGISGYRGVSDVSSALLRRTDAVGEVSPGIGIMLVAAAALVGVIASVAGIAASPPQDGPD